MEISFKDLKDLLGGEGSNPFAPWLGKNVFIRTVTHHYTGRVETLVSSQSAILKDASWIPDDGRFSDALSASDFNEVEPYPGPVQINYGAVLDITEIDILPRKQK